MAGVTYSLEAQVSGSQRISAADQFTLGFVDAANPALMFTVTSAGILPDAPFALHSLSLTLALDKDVHLFFEGLGGDNLGVILDNVVLRDNSNAQVSEPAALALLGLGLLGLAGVRRRKQ